MVSGNLLPTHAALIPSCGDASVARFALSGTGWIRTDGSLLSLQGIPGVSPRTPQTPAGPPQQQAPLQGSATRPTSSRPPRPPSARTRGGPAVARSLDLDMLIGKCAYPAAAVCVEDSRGVCCTAGSAIM